MKVAGGQARPAGEPHPPVPFHPHHRVPEGRMNHDTSHPPRRGELVSYKRFRWVR